MPNYWWSLVGSETAPHDSVRKGFPFSFSFSLSFAFALALVGAACAAPGPVVPTLAPTTVAPAPPPSATAAPSDTAVPVATAPPGTASATPRPIVPAGLSPQEQAAFADARLRLVAGDYAGAADAWRQLLSVKAAAADARFWLAEALALAGRGSDALQVLSTGEPESRDGFVRGLALDAANQHASGMQALASYAVADPVTAPAVWLEVAERELNAGRARESAP